MNPLARDDNSPEAYEYLSTPTADARMALDDLLGRDAALKVSSKLFSEAIKESHETGESANAIWTRKALAVLAEYV